MKTVHDGIQGNRHDAMLRERLATRSKAMKFGRSSVFHAQSVLKIRRYSPGEHPGTAPDTAGVVGAPDCDPARFDKISIHAGSESGTGGCAPRSGASHRLPSSVPTAPALKPPVQFRGLKPTVLHEVAPRSNRGGFLQAPCYAMKTPTLPPFNYQPRPYTGPSADEVFALRKQFLNPAIFHYYKKPIM